MLSTAVIVLLVLMVLCAVAGAIYAYIYFTRINPLGKGHRAACVGSAAGSAGHGVGGCGDSHGRHIATLSVDDDQLPGPSTHLFLFRKT